MARLLNAGQTIGSRLVLLTGVKANAPLRNAVDFFEYELMEVTADEAVKTWNINFIETKFKELKVIAHNFCIDCEGKTIGSIVREIREKQANGKSVS